jgi:Ca2+-binding EF-hand superfamily protein
MVEEIKAILADENRLGQVTKSVFDEVDADHSGKIDKTELKEALTNLSRQANLPIPNDQKIDAAFAALDTDNSGTIEIGEFKVFVKSLLESLL